MVCGSGNELYKGSLKKILYIHATIGTIPGPKGFQVGPSDSSCDVPQMYLTCRALESKIYLATI
ncbi:hypothetical protein BDV32DRAFT_127667 [Aspergillus pseudonomiae]|nr:hypothetical protein BDV32DRAFT_127667 [Aspergillus pseudonomiae]